MLLTKKRKSKLFKFLGLSKVPSLPFILGIDTGNICNLKCPLCPTGLGDSGKNRGFLSFQHFKKIFDQLKESLLIVNLFNWGEPLLNKELIKIINYIKSEKKSVKVITSTNLNVEDNELLENLINSGIDKIIVSCDGASQETYGKYRVGGDFDLVVQNMRFLVEKNQKLGNKTDITWNFLVFKHNEHEIALAKNLASEIGVNFNLGLMRTSLKDEILKPHKEAIERDKNWIPDNPDYCAYDKVNCLSKKVLKSCRKIWDAIAINWDGLVVPCCAVYEEKYSFGDTKKDSIVNIWNNPMFIKARKEILNKKIPANTICGRCRDNGFMHM